MRSKKKPSLAQRTASNLCDLEWEEEDRDDGARRIVVLGLEHSGRHTILKQWKLMRNGDDLSDLDVSPDALISRMVYDYARETKNMIQEAMADGLITTVSPKSQNAIWALQGSGDPGDHPSRAYPFLKQLWMDDEELSPVLRRLWEEHWSEEQMLVNGLDVLTQDQTSLMNGSVKPKAADYLSHPRFRTGRWELPFQQRLVPKRKRIHSLLFLMFWSRTECALEHRRYRWNDLASIVDVYLDDSRSGFYYGDCELEWKFFYWGCTNGRMNWARGSLALKPTGIIWVSSLIGYADRGYYHSDINLDEDLHLFTEVASQPAWKETRVLLVFTHLDWLRRLIADGKGLHCEFSMQSRRLSEVKGLRDSVPDFTSMEHRRRWGFSAKSSREWMDCCVAESVSFLREMYASIPGASERIAGVRVINAMDSEQVRSELFDDAFFACFDQRRFTDGMSVARWAALINEARKHAVRVRDPMVHPYNPDLSLMMESEQVDWVGNLNR